MKSVQDNSLQTWTVRQARSACATGQVEAAKHRSGCKAADYLPTDKAAVKYAKSVHGRADARPSRSAAGAGNEGTGHVLPVGLRRFSDVAVQV